MTFLRTTPFALQLGESTLPSNEALLLTYVQLIMDERLLQQLLFARELVTDTKRESIFLVNFFKEKNIPLMNITTVTTDGVPSMVGNHRRFIAQLKEFVPSVLEHLVAKHLSYRLSCSPQFVIAAVSKVKYKSLNKRLTSELCEANDEDLIVCYFIWKFGIRQRTLV
ncbi:LOW QUALITY PROTEIN: hypothetical protein M513_04973 [Trichuris suis]|uniref:DUF4371 domain-containing protein n=1 Tax=Trichuris suis TaxID=68888 RepID=A0A085MAF0_9BILA|nr:LOW QUALITY PROTEIN: hypothetical protein M513_04973 [Trichuris suis]